MRVSIALLAICAVGALHSATDLFAEAAKMEALAFLEKAAEEQQIQISLGQLATQRATNERVKEFGAQMAEDHKKASQQVEQLALKGGMQLSPGLSQEHRRKVNELAQLTGYAFDRAYMDFILKDHDTTLEQFQRSARTLRDQDITQWITSTLPTLQAHREKGRLVKYSLQTNP